MCCSDSGGITTELLTKILERMDSLNLFPRKEGGPKPFLLLDSHGSQFGLPFLCYISDKAHKWVVCIGLPNGTALWQVGDSPGQNGSWIVSQVRGKKLLINNKRKHCLPIRVDKSNIILIVNMAWQDSCSRQLQSKSYCSLRMGSAQSMPLSQPRSSKNKGWKSIRSVRRTGGGK